MLFHTRKISFSVNVLKIAIFIFFQVSQITALGVCNRQVYGSPPMQSCEAALVTIPRNVIVQYFVEQQLRRQPGTNWVAFADPRLPGQKQSVVQVPKWWSSSSCNIALVSYDHGNNDVGESLAQWFTIFTRAQQLLVECLVKGQAGGSAIVGGNGGVPVMSLFVWADGALFDEVMNSYWGTESPAAIDPINPFKLLKNANSTGDTNQTLSIISQNISIS